MLVKGMWHAQSATYFFLQLFPSRPKVSASVFIIVVSWCININRTSIIIIVLKVDRTLRLESKDYIFGPFFETNGKKDHNPSQQCQPLYWAPHPHWPLTSPLATWYQNWPQKCALHFKKKPPLVRAANKKQPDITSVKPGKLNCHKQIHRNINWNFKLL